MWLDIIDRIVYLRHTIHYIWQKSIRVGSDRQMMWIERKVEHFTEKRKNFKSDIHLYHFRTLLIFLGCFAIQNEPIETKNMKRPFLLLLMSLGTLGSENDVTQTSEEARNQAETWHSNNFMYNYPMYTSTLSLQIRCTLSKTALPNNVYFSFGTIWKNWLLLSHNAW